MKKRILSVILALILLLQAMPMQVYATDGAGAPAVNDEGLLAVAEAGQGDAAPGEAGASTWAFNQNTGYPTDLRNQVYVAIYKGNGFPGEPAWYSQDNYTFINSNFGTGGSTYASSATNVLKPEILDMLTQGPDSGNVKIWGLYSSAGTKNYFVDGSPLTKRENEEKIIRAIKGSKVDVDRYEIIWYVIKFQTDTYWHIDGLIVEKETYSVNYYGNTNSSGNAPLGETGLLSGQVHTVSGNTGGLKKVRNGYEYTFNGWNTKADGSGTQYAAGDKITVTEDISLYAQWKAPAIDISVSKQWSDSNNQDNIRPDSVTVHLLQNSQHYGTPVTLNAGNNWTASWNVPALDQSGNVISYHVEEEAVAGYTPSVSGNTAKGFVITNSHAPDTTSVQAQKIWNDDNNRDGVRPYGVEVQLYQNGNPTQQTAVMSKDTDWTAQWTALEKNQSGKVGVANVYTVQEVRLVDKNGNTVENPGYTAAYGKDAEVGRLTITNSYSPKVQSVQAAKVWDDAGNQDGIRPSSVTLTLYANGVSTGKSVTLDGVADANGEATPWVATFANVYANAEGVPVAYSIVEDAVDGYTYKVTGNAAEGFTVTNTHTPTTMSVPVTKVWNDADNQDGIRPASITVELYADGVATGKQLQLDATNHWTGSFDNLEKYHAGAQGTEISYTVVETAIPAGYTVSYNGTTITNTHVPEIIKVNVEKVWDDANDQDGKRSESVTVHLLANGEHMGERYKRVLSDENDWTITWNGLQKNYNGEPIVYTVYEEVESDTYRVSYERDADKILVINSYTPETMVVSAIKVWDDDGNRDGLRPASVTVELYANGEATGKTLELNQENQWHGQWADMPKYFDHGTAVAYDIVEIGYTDLEGNFLTGLPYGPNSASVAEESEFAPGMFIITNTHTPATTGVTVTKTWDDGDDNDGKRPDGILVQLYANREAIPGAVVELNEANRWTYTWTRAGEESLYVYEDGKPITYSVDEVGYVIDGKSYDGLPEGYTKDLASEGYETNITNTHALEKMDVSAGKIWNDGSNNDGLRPQSLDVTLYCNDQAVATIALSEENGWAYTWKNLNQYIGGEKAVYTVKEASVEGYTSAVTNEGNVWIFVNTHEIVTEDLTVSKVWADHQDAEGLRPDSIKVQIYKNGEVYGAVRTLTKENNWQITVQDVPVYEAGKEIVWSVAEVEIPKYYSASYDQTTLTITNTIQSKEIPKTGDNSNLMLWSGTMFVGMAGMFVLLLNERKRHCSR